jgi:hypothetical protein
MADRVGTVIAERLAKRKFDLENEKDDGRGLYEGDAESDGEVEALRSLMPKRRFRKMTGAPKRRPIEKNLLAVRSSLPHLALSHS